MGFGGLLHLASSGMQLPRQLAYWLLTRVDPVSKILISPDGKEFSLSPNQVYWVLGIPNGGKTVPTKKNMTSKLKYKVEAILNKYWQSWETTCNGYEGKVYTSKGISVNPRLMERLDGEWMEWEEVEFKTLFLLLSLHMVLCATHSPKLSADLVPALTCAHDCMDYDWCGLVVSKLLGSVSSFARKFYANGYVGGSGGCLLFIVIMYLDRLNRVPLRWGVFRRIKVWNMKEIGSVSRLDRHSIDGDFGKMGVSVALKHVLLGVFKGFLCSYISMLIMYIFQMIDVAYAESHPKEARDSNGPSLIQPNEEVIPYIFKPPKARRIRCATNPCFVRNPLPDESVLYMEVGEMICNVQQEEQTDCVDLVVGTPGI
ncbi:uncharacterized protein LOC110695600 [Chenopodium quinoa]|uniref:uncharacterized protein LOC110695600 n=1 Tax=Chenopodium quinoa TaxID=63459 RepID=UPI000B78764F|nr:uncharacterized protein LOC110695600 [Chenopodium quinoa]